MNQLYSLFFKKNSNIENIDEPINDHIKVKETTDVLKLQEIVIDTETSSKKIMIYIQVLKIIHFFPKILSL